MPQTSGECVPLGFTLHRRSIWYRTSAVEATTTLSYQLGDGLGYRFLGLTLVANNTGKFGRVQDLDIENWID